MGGFDLVHSSAGPHKKSGGMREDISRMGANFMWKKTFILVTIAVILAADMFIVGYYVHKELNCPRRNYSSVPVSYDYREPAFDYSSLHELDAYVGAFGMVKSSDHDISDVLRVLPDALFRSSEPIVFLDVLAALVAFVIYRAIEKKKAGEPWVVMLIFTLATMSFFIAVMVMTIGTYISRAKNAASSVRAHAPVIYLYNENNEEELINVQLDLDGELDVTYPVYDTEEGWTVTATSDGVLTDENGDTYHFLFWDGKLNMDYDLSRGFCVRGCDTEEFLNEALSELGLNEAEARGFMVYWLPLMEGNEYNVITFQTTAYDDAVTHVITPAPDVTVSVNMLWYATTEYVEIKPQELDGINPALSEREGLTFVEWGGEEISEPA